MHKYLDNRTLTRSSLNSFAYNGMLKDDEVSGNSYTTEFRQYDARLGRWTATDPLMNQFPWMSTYCGFDNNPILLKDPKGLSSEEGDKDKKEGDAPKENNEKEYKSKDQIIPIIIRPNEQKVDNEQNNSYKGLRRVGLGDFVKAFKTPLRDFDASFDLTQRSKNFNNALNNLVLTNMLFTGSPLIGYGLVTTAPLWSTYLNPLNFSKFTLSERLFSGGVNATLQITSSNADFRQFDIISFGSSLGSGNPFIGNGVSSLATYNLKGEFKTLGNGISLKQVTSNYVIGLLSSKLIKYTTINLPSTGGPISNGKFLQFSIESTIGISGANASKVINE